MGILFKYIFSILIIILAIPVFIIWLRTVSLFFSLFIEYPILLISLLGIPAGVCIYFYMFEEDKQKLIELYNNILNWRK